MIKLPLDMQLQVLGYLGMKDLLKTGLVCKLLWDLTRTGILWKNLCMTEMGIRFSGPEPDWLEAFKALYFRESKCGHKRVFDMKMLCCGSWVSCRACHEVAGLSWCSKSQVRGPRPRCSRMLCRTCGLVQEPGKKCTGCPAESSYYCSLCHIWSNSPNFHCMECRMCNTGPESGSKHCFNCGFCIRADRYPTHFCLKDQSSMACPGCKRNLPMGFVEMAIAFMPCGHAIHVECLEVLLHDEKPCPSCGIPL